MARRHAGPPGQQPPAPARLLFQKMGPHLDGHASGHLAHRRKERQKTVVELHGFVGHRGHPGIEQRLGQLRQRRQVEVGKKDQPRSQQRIFRR